MLEFCIDELLLYHFQHQNGLLKFPTLVFPKILSQMSGLLQEENIILAEGRINLREDEEPKLTAQQLEDILYENKKAYDNGYAKGFHDALKEYPPINSKRIPTNKNIVKEIA